MRPLALVRGGAILTLATAEAMGTKAVHTGPAVFGMRGEGLEEYTCNNLWQRGWCLNPFKAW